MDYNEEREQDEGLGEGGATEGGGEAIRRIKSCWGQRRNNEIKYEAMGWGEIRSRDRRKLTQRGATKMGEMKTMIQYKALHDYTSHDGINNDDAVTTMVKCGLFDQLVGGIIQATLWYRFNIGTKGGRGNPTLPPGVNRIV